MRRRDELGETLRRLWAGLRGGREGQANGARVEVAPASAFEAVLEQRLKELEAQVEEVKGRVNGLLYLVAGTVLLEVVLRLVK
ncbi:MAG: hypothetical protein Q7T26_04480 [Dehalococcoidia bacterium]|nr:hypothetical protein [Dehalococcoidia bacterium]